ncbi:MAG: acetyl-CoA decarbonylase/synthase complex subunit delta [Bacillota bacterium]
MAVAILKDRNPSKVLEVTIGATKEQGGTRSHTITVGGDSALPFMHFEGSIPNRPVIAMEIQDRIPKWNDSLKSELGDVWGNPTEWAQKCVEDFGANLIYLKLDGSHPDEENYSPDKCAQTVKSVLEAVSVPLIVCGCDVEEKDNEVLPLVAEAAAGENLLIGSAEQDNYKTLTAACMVHKHSIIARSPLDINICKQLNILITEMNLPSDRIIIDPAIGGLGYGIEYAYSILERARLGALQGDKMLSMPIIATIGYESWKTKEASVSIDDYPNWGQQVERGILWEAVTATSLLQAGVHILLLRHPKTVQLVQNTIDELMKPNQF